MGRTITVKPVVLAWLGLLAPSYVGVFPALHRQRLLILAARRAGVGRILRYLIRRHKVIIPSHIFGAEPFGHAGAYAGVMFVSWARWRHSYRLSLRAYEAVRDRRPTCATAHVDAGETKRAVEDATAAEPLVESGGFVHTGVKTTAGRELGYRCAVCGFGSWFKRCSRGASSAARD